MSDLHEQMMDTLLDRSEYDKEHCMSVWLGETNYSATKTTWTTTHLTYNVVPSAVTSAQ